ncbi:hypothetical protein [Streptomyces sp. TLI_105]|uniref:hypothetical protein n=1 Tax=Streptomyces sp. TLI_105 TaxID=1881019 RepID=UPI00089656CD|nr:hypothetical protein [Streptomyces sp. TLI_105]SED51707.1 hypothetical protein SAMN05428939_5419 [Streptomyces sp. TLI_105]
MPTPANRAANAALGLALGLGSLAYGAEAGTGWERAAVVVAVLGCGILAVRGFRAGVRCEAERLVVRGFVRTRVIPRAAVTGVTDFPSVRWTSPRGRPRWTPVTVFAEVSGETGGARSRKRGNTARLRRWAARGQTRCPGTGGRSRLPG